MRGAGRPASAAAARIVGATCSRTVRGPTQASDVPSASRPVTRSACGPSAATSTGGGLSGFLNSSARHDSVSPAKSTLPSWSSGIRIDRYSRR